MKKLALLLALTALFVAAASLLARDSVFNLKNSYDRDGYWIGCPDSGNECAHFGGGNP